MALLLTEEELRSVGLTPEDARRELAVYLFSQDRLTLGQASRLAALSQAHFMRLLAQRGISLHYSVDDLDADLRTLEDLNTS